MDCLLPPDEGGCAPDGTSCQRWFNKGCLADAPEGSAMQDCQDCGRGTFMIRDCTYFNAKVFTPCAANLRKDPVDGRITHGHIEHCRLENHRCHPEGQWIDAVAGLGVHHILAEAAAAWDGRIADFQLPGGHHKRQILSYCATHDPNGARCNDSAGEECNMDACDLGFLGPQCQYAKVFSGCGAEHFMERSAKRGKRWYDEDIDGLDIHYPGDHRRGPNSWIAWCMRECEEHPFCHAFEIDDGGETADESGSFEVTAESTCKLFRRPDFCPVEGATDDIDYAKDCYVHVRRDPQALQRERDCPGPMPS